MPSKADASVKVLFDHNVPRKLRRFLAGHEVSTASEMGWATLENGQLIATAEDTGFALMVTGDKNISYQQNLSHRRIALVVLSTNNWNIVKLNAAAVIRAVDSSSPGSFQFVAFTTQ
jgi:hypothetical protein